MGLADLKEKAGARGDFAKAWAYREGDRDSFAGEGNFLYGEVVNVDVREAKGRKPYPIVTISVAEGTEGPDNEAILEGTQRAFHAQAASAQGQLEDLDVEEGDTLYVRFDGTYTSKAGNVGWDFALATE